MRLITTDTTPEMAAMLNGYEHPAILVTADYRILAPTEWNFHPQGPLNEGLRGLRPGPQPVSERDLEARARLIAQSLDPCVALSLDLTHA